MESIAKTAKNMKIDSMNGIDVYYIKTDKFKTNSINIFFHDVLSSENASKNALLPAVLRRGCSKFPSQQEIALELERLYGAVFDCGVVKKGERQILHFYIDHISDKYTDNDINVFERAFDLMYEIITNPVVKNGAFREDYVEQEKNNLKNLINGRINDKMHYAIERCFEVMCEDEPFGIYEYGSVDQVAKIDGKELYEHYKKVLETLPITVFIAGDVEERKIKHVVEKLSAIKRGNIKKVDISFVNKKVEKVKNVTERMNVTQGKLSLGFRTNTCANDKDYYALVVCNGILGVGVHCKLFQNVREKASLAYYAMSRLERYKGLMIITSGIETANKEKAQEIMLKQIEEIKTGNISDFEYESTLKVLENGIKSLTDSQLNMVDFYLSQMIANTNDDFETIVEKYKSVKKQDVVEVAHKIQLDTVYFLTSNE